MSLSAEAVSLQLHGNQVLNHVHLHCQPGEILALCGGNGAGKSSLLRTLAGEIPDFQGTVKINGRNLMQMAPALLAQYRAVMPQEMHLNFDFSGAEVIALGLIFMKWPQKMHLVKQVATLLDAQHLLGKGYCQCSGGEKQRLHLARTIAQLFQSGPLDNKYLLLDECSSAMDLAMAELAFGCLRQLASQGVGVVAVIHDLNLAAAYCDTVLMLKHGKVDCQGKPAAVITSTTVARVFGAGVRVLNPDQCPHPVVIPNAT